MLRLMLLLLVLTVSASCAEDSATNNAKTDQITLFVPLYSWPNLSLANNEWQRVADAASSVSVIAVINPNSGPLSPAPAVFLDGISLLQQAGVKVLGYIPSGYGGRSEQLMQADMDTYGAYHVDGFFFDEVETSGAITRYQTLCNYPTATFTVLNPGTSFPNAYIDNGCDMAVIYENTEALWSGHQLSKENAKLSAHQMISLVHSATASSDKLQSSIQKSVDLTVGALMITDQTTSMWITLPTHFTQQVQVLAQTKLQP